MFDKTPGFKRLFAADAEGAAGANPETASTDDILATLRHDPFPKGEAPKAEPTLSEKKTEDKPKAVEPSASAKAAGTDGKTADGGGVVTQPAKTESQGDPEKDALKQSLSHASELLEAYKNRGKDPEPAKGAKPEASESDEPTYDFNIPDNLVQALTSTDPAIFKQGLAGMTKGVGLGIHAQVMKQLPKVMEATIAQVLPRYVQAAIETYNSRKSIFDDFYGTYKEFNNPKLYPVVSEVTKEVMGELKTDKWSPAVRDLVGKRVKDFLTSLGVTAPAAITEQKPSAHPTLVGGNNSRQPAGNADAFEKDIMDTLFG